MPGWRRAGAILLVVLLVQQCSHRFVDRERPPKSVSAVDVAAPAALVEESPAAVARPSAIRRRAAGIAAITPSTVAAVARGLPAAPRRASPTTSIAERVVPTESSAIDVDRIAAPARVAAAAEDTSQSRDTPAAVAPAATTLAELDANAAEGGPAPYRDQYLLGDDADVGIGFAGARSARSGRRFVEVEAIYYDSNDDFFGGETEKGVRTRWRQETLNWGEFDAQLIFSDIESDFLGRQFANDEIYFTLRQTNAPLENGWLMNNAAGHQRTLVDPFLHSGYRIRLPTSLFLGVSMSVATDRSTAGWYTGKTGDNRGIAVPQFRENGGEILGGSWRALVSDEFTIGAEVVDFDGNDLVRGHTSLLAAGSFDAVNGRTRHALHALADDDSNFGLWADSRNVVWSDLVLRYGAFYLEPELAWMDRPIVNDQYGAYARADKRTFVYNYSVGVDYTKAGVDSTSPFDADYQSLYANGNYRLTRKLSIGVNGNLLLREFRSTTDDSQVAWRLSNFANYRFPLGLGRLELYASQLDSEFDANNNDTYGVRASYDWDMPQGYRLTTEAQAEEQRRLSLDNSNQRFSVLFRQSLASNLSWGINTTYFRNDDALLSKSSGIGINADTRWQFLPDWFVSASLVHNQSSVDAPAANLIGGETEFESDAFWLRVGYASASGLPHRRFGRGSGGAGAGRIGGQVFFDENRDFIRQAGERPAVGVVVVIDGRYEVRTDAQGRYEFDPVYPGPHRVALIAEDLPLPWGLDDEAARAVDVRVRQASEIDFPLVDLTGL
ncbi:MAG: carboxypeptidase-like regulatory domain-containing protein [Gammaproteobacteria bacterium]